MTPGQNPTRAAFIKAKDSATPAVKADINSPWSVILNIYEPFAIKQIITSYLSATQVILI